MFKFHRFVKPEKCSKLLTGIKNAHCTARPIIYSVNQLLFACEKFPRGLLEPCVANIFLVFITTWV